MKNVRPSPSRRVYLEIILYVKAVHLINPMRNAAGGSEWRTIHIFERLADRTEVTVWSDSHPDSALAGLVPIRRIDHRLNAVPRGGNMVFIGSYCNTEPWLAHTDADRYLVLHNVDEPHLLSRILNRLEGLGKGPVEVAYASTRLRERSRGPHGEIHPSPIDLGRFRPRPRPDHPFTVGKMSRDDLTKHHPDDGKFYRRLANQGVRVRVMGGMRFREELGDIPGIELLPCGAEAPEDFLSTLDAFFFRTHPDWFESSARVVAEAMASGVPVVAEERHGYTDYFAGGILFGDEEEAFEAILRLKNEPAFCNGLAYECRQKAENWFGDSAIEATLESYLR